jgi:hypothetical protein
MQHHKTGRARRAQEFRCPLSDLYLRPHFNLLEVDPAAAGVAGPDQQREAVLAAALGQHDRGNAVGGLAPITAAVRKIDKLAGLGPLWLDDIDVTPSDWEGPDGAGRCYVRAHGARGEGGTRSRSKQVIVIRLLSASVHGKQTNGSHFLLSHIIIA